jgi:DNA-directed RNA polymerase subunit H (RpoH/RPB5)
MKFREKLGSEDVQDLLREISARAAELPRIDFRDPWPSDRYLDVEAIVANFESTKQKK